jgi:LruC domain-containing protein
MKTSIHRLLFVSSLLALGLSACKKENVAGEESESLPASIYDLKVSDNFNFSSTKDIQLNVRVESGSYAGEKFKINVYTDLPTVGSRISSGIVAAGSAVSLQFRVASAQQHLYVEKIASSGASELHRVPVTNYISTDFKKQTPEMMLKKKPSSGRNCNISGATVNNSSNFTSNNAALGTVQLTSSNGTISINNMSSGVLDIAGKYSGSINLTGGTINISGKYSGSIQVNGGGSGATIQVCGTGENISINMNNPADRLYFIEGSVVSIQSLGLNAAGCKVENYSDSLRFNSSAGLGSSFENNGKMSVHGDLDINNTNGNSFVNNGELYVEKTLNNNRSLTNNHKIVTGSNYHANNPSTNINNCNLTVGGDFHINTTFNNNGYVKVYDETFVNGGTLLAMGSNAQVSTKDLIFNGKISGTSQPSVVSVAAYTLINGGASMSGAVKLCDADGINTNNSNISATYFSCATSNYIPTSACNPEGFGEPEITDADNDGVPDALDEYPNDPDRAYNSYYPSASTWATVGFEDLWPSQGDYDFNDMIVSYRLKKVLNASNKVVEVYNTLLVRAVGAAYDNGFGIQLDGVTPGEISGVSGYSLTKGIINLNANKTEAGQTKAVVIAFDTPEPLLNRAGGSMFNTIKANPAGTSDTLNLHISFTSPLDDSKITLNKINPFIFIDGDRGKEVHLPNHTPTDKANTALLGTNRDSSNPSIGRYYKTANNLPFAIEIPVWFDYPAEKESISDAYHYFIPWAVSGGTSYANWYDNHGGFRNPAKIY